MLMTWVLHGQALLVAWTDWPPSLHGPALLLVPTIFPPDGFAIPCRYTPHHPYICPCFWRKHFYIPLFLHFLWNANYTLASQLLRLPNNSGNKGALHGPALLVAWTNCPPPPSLHGPALLLVPTIFPPGGFAIPCRYTLHHPYPRGSTIDTLMCL